MGTYGKTPTSAAFKATRNAALEDPEVLACYARATEWRNSGDHVAAHDCELDAAGAFRYAWRRLAARWDEARALAGITLA